MFQAGSGGLVELRLYGAQCFARLSALCKPPLMYFSWAPKVWTVPMLEPGHQSVVSLLVGLRKRKRRSDEGKQNYRRGSEECLTG